MGSQDWMSSGRRRAPRLARTCHQRPPLPPPAPPCGPSILATKRWLLVCTRPHRSSARNPSRPDGARHRKQGTSVSCLLFQSAGTLPEPSGRLPRRSRWSELGDMLTPKSVPGRRDALDPPGLPAGAGAVPRVPWGPVTWTGANAQTESGR